MVHGFKFSSESLEREYQRRLVDEKVRLTRILTVLTVLLTLAFAALDLWAVPSALADVWAIRGLMCSILAMTFLSTWLNGFRALYPYVIVFTFLALGLGINAMIYLAKATEIAAEVYYGGLILIIMGMYSLTLVSPWLSSALSLVLMLVYLAIVVIVHRRVSGPDGVQVVAHLYFFVSTAAVGFVAQSLRDRYSRENYLLRHSLQRDVELKEEETRRASYLAEHDPLTGLANRLGVQHDVTAMFEHARGSGQSVVIMFIDLDGFKPINDHHGHAAGDRALKVIAERFRHILRPGDVVARVGGDEFAVAMLVSDGEEAAIAETAARLAAAVERGIDARGTRLHITACVGVAKFPDDGQDLDAVLREADGQMYRVKRAGKSGVAMTRACTAACSGDEVKAVSPGAL